MAKIVGIHGIANTFRTAAQLTSDWGAALQGALEEAGRRHWLAERDLVVVAYGALFRLGADGKERIPSRGGASRAAKFEPIEDWECDLVEAWWRAASALSADNRRDGGTDPLGEDAGIQPPEFEGRARTPQFLQRGLVQLAKSRFFRPLAPALLVSELRQLRLFLHDKNFKEAILRRVAEQVGPDTRVVIGHSLGSVVAYEALCAHPDWRVHTFLSLGSPLGIPNVVFDALATELQDGRRAWPNVAQWVNIADKGDLVALVKELAPLFGPVQDTLVHNGWRSHDVNRYLCAREAGLAVASALEATGAA